MSNSNIATIGHVINGQVTPGSSNRRQDVTNPATGAVTAQVALANTADVAQAVAPEARQTVVGIRPGEKLHEQMIGPEDAAHTYEYPEHFKILPAINNWSSSPARIKDGVKVDEDFTYASDTNPEWMSDADLQAWIKANKTKIGAI